MKNMKKVPVVVKIINEHTGRVVIMFRKKYKKYIGNFENLKNQIEEISEYIINKILQMQITVNVINLIKKQMNQIKKF